MEDSGEMNSGDENTHSDKNKKRTIKTRAQVEALEKFYDEHKYPTELMKSQLAESLGLTEKQISGWFCHRRLKDKRLFNGEVYLNGKQDRSSGVIQDRGSGLRQDSCGSTKQGDDRTSDPREVESRRLTGVEFSTPDLTHEFGGHSTRNYNCMDDTSLGSTSSLRNTYFPHNADSFDEGTSRYLTNSCPTDLKTVKPRNGPSGYLKVKGHVENSAITAVKRQLGRQYREDGPPLGVEFEPLPPGAFESPMQNNTNNSYHAGERDVARSEDFPKVHKQSNSSTGYGYYSKISSRNLDMLSEKLKRPHGTDHSEKCFNQKLRQKSFLPVPEYSASVRNSPGDKDEVPAREMLFNSRDNHQLMAKHGGEMRIDSVANQCLLSPNSGRMTNEQAEPRLKRNYEASLKASQVEHFECKPSTVRNRVGIYHDVREKGISKSLKKDDLFCRDGAILDESCNQGQLKIPRKYETTDVKRTSNHMSNSREFARNASLAGMPLPTNHQGTRSAAEMPSSFSEDDVTTETSSSEE
ncbi:uncharacterized protein LOC116004924 [Ipomoea triloba]|uniref:uncharacterized protein LOC116004924 n=1 Tax=Ipomoea triloba TaxID=35885 RepID=UPI00125DF109|nr:uncharacterized protein LOC116004924 [Ipomoea triloba]